MRKTLLAATAIALAATAVRADVVQMPAGDDLAAQQRTTLPRKGTTMQAVLRAYGEPQTKHAPAGGDSPKHPPITRWDYAGFSVFFERSHVVDAVIPGAPTPVYHADQLKPAS